MEKAFSFDFVHDTQYVFRIILDSVSHPMRKYSLDKIVNRFEEQSVMNAIGCTLLDNETSFYVEKDPKLVKNLIDLTLSNQVDADEADYIFLSSMLNYETIKALLEQAKKGTLADPQWSATFIVGCDSLEGNVRKGYVGAGIKGEIMVDIPQYIATICELRDKILCEYPCGIDICFVTADGEIMSAPRLCKSRKVEK